MGCYTTVFFDFGGVLAEEGFREGLKAIGRNSGIDPEKVVHIGTEVVYASGYVVGAVGEDRYWNEFRRRTGITAPDQELRGEILSRFVLRPEMFQAVRQLKTRGYTVAILSDQTNWLDELDARHGVFSLFDRVFNSYHQGRSKKDPHLFVAVTEEMGIAPAKTLFLDDNAGNIERAEAQGLKGILVDEGRDALKTLEEVLAIEFAAGQNR